MIDQGREILGDATVANVRSVWLFVTPPCNDLLARDALSGKDLMSDWLKDRIHPAVPAAMVGKKQETEVSPYSGLSNVRHWLRAHDLNDEDKGLAQRILDAPRTSNHTLSAAEIMALVQAP